MLKVDLLPHQVEGVDFFEKHKWTYCGDEMGVGKTIEAMGLIERLGGCSTTIVCPAMLRDNWLEEFEEKTHFSASKKFTNSKINVISYEGAVKYPELLRKDLVVFDESHYLKNLRAKRTMAVHKALNASNPNVLLMSGTPITNRIPDLYSPLRLLSKEPTGVNGRRITDIYRTQNQFNNRFTFGYSFSVGRAMVQRWQGKRNVEELKTFMRQKYIRRKASSVLTLPPSERQFIDASIKDSGLDAELQREWENSKAGRAGSSTNKKKVALAKVDFTTKFVKNIMEQEDSCVVFSDHPAVLHEIKKGIKGFVVEIMEGDTPMDKRQPMAKRFQNGETDILLLSIPAASVGLTLTRSRIAVFNDASWSPASNRQAEKRIDRLTQTRESIKYYIVGTKMDKLITKANSEKEEDASIVDEI